MGTPTVNNEKARLIDEWRNLLKDNMFASYTSVITDEGSLEDNRKSQLSVGNIVILASCLCLAHNKTNTAYC